MRTNGLRDMKQIICLFLVALLYISCSRRDSTLKNYTAETAFEIDEQDLIPEGIACDEKTGRFFLSSKNKNKIIVIDGRGTHSDFIKSDQAGMLGSLGLKVDAERRRLWAVSNKVYDTQKVSAVHVFDVDTGSLIRRFYAPSGERYHLNDLVVTESGAVYITDTQGGHILTVPADLQGLSLFTADQLISRPNGITIAPDNTVLYIESDNNGILLVDIETKEVSRIGNPLSVETGGIDGLMFYKNSLIGIVNSQYENFEYIVRYRLSPDGREITGVSIIDMANPAFVTPTTGVIAGDCLYVLAATCLDIFNSNRMDQEELLKNPLILRYALE